MNGVCALSRSSSSPPLKSHESEDDFDEMCHHELSRSNEGSFSRSFSSRELRMPKHNRDIVTIDDDDCFSAGGKLRKWSSSRSLLSDSQPPPPSSISTDVSASETQSIKLETPVFRRFASEHSLSQSSTSSKEVTSVSTRRLQRRRKHLSALDEKCRHMAAEAAQERAEKLRRHLIEEDVRYNANKISNALKNWYASNGSLDFDPDDLDDKPPEWESSSSNGGSSRGGTRTASSASKKSLSDRERMMAMTNTYGRERCPPAAAARAPASQGRYGEEKWELLEDEDETVAEPDDLDATSVDYRARRGMCQRSTDDDTVEDVPDTDANSVAHQLRRASMSLAEHSGTRSTTSSQESPLDVLYFRDTKPASRQEEQYGPTMRGGLEPRPCSVVQDKLNSGALPFSSDKKPSKVRFSDLQIRHYDQILGDNPSCTSGPSLSIGWSYDRTDVRVMDVDSYERLRCKDRVPAKHSRDLMVSREKREALLKRLGYSDDDIAKAVRKNVKARFQRTQTANNVGMSGVEEILEGMNKSFLKTMKGKRKKKSDGANCVETSRGLKGVKEMEIDQGRSSESSGRARKTKLRSTWRTPSGRLKGL